MPVLVVMGVLFGGCPGADRRAPLRVEAAIGCRPPLYRESKSGKRALRRANPGGRGANSFTAASTGVRLRTEGGIDRVATAFRSALARPGRPGRPGSPDGHRL